MKSKKIVVKPVNGGCAVQLMTGPSASQNIVNNRTPSKKLISVINKSIDNGRKRKTIENSCF